MSYTTNDLLVSVRNRGSIPSTTNDNNVNSNQNLLNIATEQLHTKLYPLLQSTREEFYVAPPKDYAITANQAEYEIPSRASGLVCRDVLLIKGNQIISLPLKEREYIKTSDTGDVEGFYFRHNKVVLYKTPSTTQNTLRLIYYLRPSRLAVTTDCAQIASIDTGANTVTVSSIPSTWAANTEVDFVEATSPYAPLEIDQTITNVASTTITFSSLPDNLAVGDWLAPAGYTPIPQVPFEMLPILAQLTVVKTLEAMGDREGAKHAYTDLQTDLENMMKLIQPRSHGENKKIIQRSWGFRS